MTNISLPTTKEELKELINSIKDGEILILDFHNEKEPVRICPLKNSD